MLIPSFMLHPTLLKKMMKIHLSKHYTDSRGYLCLMEHEARKRKVITKCESAQESQDTDEQHNVVIRIDNISGKRKVTDLGGGGTDLEVAMRAPMVGRAN
jgi:hypothetical protein